VVLSDSSPRLSADRAAAPAAHHLATAAHHATSAAHRAAADADRTSEAC